MELDGVPATDREDAVSIESGTAVSACIFSVSGYHQSDLFVRIKQFEDPDIPLNDDSLLQTILWRTLFRMYRFDFSRGTSSGTSFPEMIDGDITTPSTEFMAVFCQILNYGANVSLLDRSHHLVVMQQVQVEDGVVRFQQYILVCLIAREDDESNSEAERINRRILANKMTGIMSRDFTFVYLRKTILNFVILLER